MEKNIEHNKLISFIWSIAESLRDVYKRGKYKDIILPMIVIRRFDAYLETKKEEHDKLIDECKSKNLNDHEILALEKLPYFNRTKLFLRHMLNESGQQKLKAKFISYLEGFSVNVRDILEKFDFFHQVDKLSESNVLFTIIQKFVSNKINLSPNDIDGEPGLDNHAMGTVFEEIIRKFSEENNEESGEHFTPRDVVELMGELAVLPVIDKMEEATYMLYDGACGTLGMCTVASDIIKKHASERNKQIDVLIYGQEVNAETYAIAKADMLIKGNSNDSENIRYGSTISNDGFRSEKFTFMLSNPPYGKNWENDLALLTIDTKTISDSRFLAKAKDNTQLNMIPPVSDGQMLFLLNNISKMEESGIGSRIVEVHNASALYNGDAGSGPNNIRRYIIENDLLEAIIHLPKNIFYNTGIPTYIWILANKKEERRKGKIQLIDATELKTNMKANLGQKSIEISQENKLEILKLYQDFKETENSKIFNNEFFGYYEITVDRPLKEAINLSNENINKMESLYNQILGLTNTELINKLTQLGLGKTKASLSELTDKEKMSAHFEILKQLQSVDLYLNTTEFKYKYNKLAKKYNIKELTFQKLKDTGLLSLCIQRNQNADIIYDKDENIVPDLQLRDKEIVPMNYKGGIQQFINDEVIPYFSDAFVSEKLTKVGYEISFTKVFYKPYQLEKVTDIIKKINDLEKETSGYISDVLKDINEQV
ncbi:type I restriction-modification system subunit M [Mycoplasma sp. AC1221]